MTITLYLSLVSNFALIWYFGKISSEYRDNLEEMRKEANRLGLLYKEHAKEIKDMEKEVYGDTTR